MDPPFSFLFVLACSYNCSYNVHIIQEVGRLWASVESTRAELAPRKRFAFRSKAKTKRRDARRGGGGIPAREDGLARKGVDETGDGKC